jgi:NADPH2:quinone reductase
MTMHAIQAARTGGPEVLEWREIPTPEPSEGELLVAIEAAGLNYVETYHRRGIYARDLPFVLGGEGAGKVTAVGPGVIDFAVGDRVASTSFQGSYAEHSVVATTQAIRIPDDVCLIHAGAGGVGRLLIQMAKKLEATVIATASTEAKVELASSAGADHVVNYTQEKFAEAVESLVGPTALAAVFDGVGAATFDEGLTLLRPRGVMVLFGQSSGVVPPFDLGRLASLGSLYVTRPTLSSYVASRVDLERRAGDVFSWIADGTLDVRIPRRWPLQEAALAHTELEGRRTTGKVLLIP